MPPTMTFAAHLAETTGKLLLDYFQRDNLHAQLKADHTIVTEGDFAADQHITAEIQAAYPGEGIISEESSLLLEDTDRPVWVIDPLDGTTNFSLGLPVWGVSIARLVNGVPDTAALYFPVTGELFAAQRGEGAYYNQQRLSIIDGGHTPLKPYFATGSRALRRYQVNIRYKMRIMGAVAYDFCSVARGSAIVGFSATPKLWDLAAGWLVVQEAGGIVEVLSGPPPFPIQPNLDYSQTDYPTILAATPAFAAEARQGIKLK